MRETTTPPQFCQFCGSEAVPPPRSRVATGGQFFSCGNVWRPEWPEARVWQTGKCILAERERLTRERDEARERVASAIADRDTARGRAEQVWKLREEFVALLGTDDIQKGVETVRDLRARVKRLEEAGQLLDDVADAADDDIREHLQVANYNLHGFLNTGERIQPPNPPQTIHQAGIDASVAVREDIRKARNEWRKAKEATP